MEEQIESKIKESMIMDNGMVLEVNSIDEAIEIIKKNYEIEVCYYELGEFDQKTAEIRGAEFVLHLNEPW